MSAASRFSQRFEFPNSPEEPGVCIIGDAGGRALQVAMSGNIHRRYIIQCALSPCHRSFQSPFRTIVHPNHRSRTQLGLSHVPGSIVSGR